VAKGAGESVLVHLKTQKGKGYAPAEEDPDKYHGLHPSHKEKTDSNFSLEMGRALCDIAKDDDRICAITAAMSSGTGLDEFAKAHRDRFFDVGIAEEHAVTFAAGLAANGMRPVFAVYSSFLQRSYDQMIHDVALQGLPVVICVDRAGFNESDGATHHGIFDVAFASQIPGLKIYSPVTYSALRLCLGKALRENLPSLIRYPSGHELQEVKNAFYSGHNNETIGVKCYFSPERMPDNIIITHGRIVSEAMKAKQLLAKENINVGIVLCEYVSPYGMLADDVVRALGGATPKTLFFLEEEIKNGGFGMLLSDKMKDLGVLNGVRYRILASENAFVKRNVGESYIKASGLDYESIAEAIKNL
jgi:1-deoxy-D-xylulose-5-phosphate synthase